METLNYTEEQSLELFELMADLQEAQQLEKQAWEEYQQAYKRATELQSKCSKIECRIYRIKADAIIRDCPYTEGQKFIVNHDIYDQIKIDYVSGFWGVLDIRIKGRRKATKGWDYKSTETTIENIQAMTVYEL